MASPLPDDCLHTPRLRLRRFRVDDAAALHEIFAHPEAMRYWSTRPHAGLAETVAWIEKTIRAGEAGRADEFLIEQGGQVIGKAGLWRPYEMGIILAREAWGHGYGREAGEAVVNRAFGRGVPAITADVDPRNTRSLQLLRALGFRETGFAAKTVQVEGEWADSVYLELRNPGVTVAG